MRRRSTWILLGVVVVVLLVIGGFAIFHNPSKTSNNTNPSTNTGNGSTSAQSTPPTANNAVVITKTDPNLGPYLADPSGRALYTFGGDSSGVSNCTGSCLAAWPAYQATGSTTSLPTGITTIKRIDNGQTQYALNGKPLYFFASDSNGQVTGNGVNDFQVAKPSTSSASPSSSSPSGSGSNSSSSSPY